MKLAMLAIAAAACTARALPETRYYSLAPPARERLASLTTPPTGPAIAVEGLDAEQPYDDERMVYRLDPYRLDYYDYHRWASAPGALIAGYLGDAFERSGRFRAVARAPDDSTAIVVGGRVLAIEEVDVAQTRWVGRIAIELTATDRESGRVLWTKRYDETEPMPAQSPAGLARALTAAMQRISQRAVVDLVDSKSGMTRVVGISRS